jgi:hypothetical protein
VAGTANHPRRHGRVDHVAVRSVHEETDTSSQGRSAALRGFDGSGIHVVTPANGTGRLTRPRLLRVTAGWDAGAVQGLLQFACALLWFRRLARIQGLNEL